MYNIIPLILILISISIIIAITVKKFSVLVDLDVENIQSEKEARVKEQIINDRMRRNFVKLNVIFLKIFNPIRASSEKLYSKLIELKDNHKKEYKEISPEINDEQDIEKLFLNAEELRKKDEFNEAENKLVKIISLDSRNIKAFYRLGRIYLERKDYEEATQTFEHILKLVEDEDLFSTEDGIKEFNKADIYFNLALVSRAVDNLDEAIINIKEALKLEPNNPRYIDTGLEASIMKKDKILSLEFYDKLAEVNPDNQKLEDFKKQIREL